MGRSVKEIIDNISEHPETSLNVLGSLTLEESNDIRNLSKLLPALQRLRGLAVYEAVAAYAMGVDRGQIAYEHALLKCTTIKPKPINHLCKKNTDDVETDIDDEYVFNDDLDD